MPSEDQVVANAEQPGEQTNTPKLGVALAKLTPETRQSLNLSDDTKGVVVTDVQPGSPAAEQGPAAGRRDRPGRPQAGQRPQGRSRMRCARRRSAATRRSCCWSSARVRTGSWRSRSSGRERRRFAATSRWDDHPRSCGQPRAGHGGSARPREPRVRSQSKARGRRLVAGPSPCLPPERPAVRPDHGPGPSLSGPAQGRASIDRPARQCDNRTRFRCERGWSCAVRAAASMARRAPGSAPSAVSAWR